jgi:hypothetical protein
MARLILLSLSANCTLNAVLKVEALVIAKLDDANSPPNNTSNVINVLEPVLYDETLEISTYSQRQYIIIDSREYQGWNVPDQW